MSSVPVDLPRLTLDEYFRREAGSEVKHDYLNGYAVAMAGGSPRHSLVTANVSRAIGNALTGKPCNVFDSNLLIGIPNSPYTHYPDVSVICGPLEFDPRDPGKNTVTNPVVIVEVLSPGTIASDRGDKFDRDRQLESLREYMLVFQDRAEIQTFFRRDDGTWLLRVVTGEASTVWLNALDVELNTADIYRGVTFDPPAAA